MAEPGFLKNRKMAEPMLKNVFICKYFKQLKEEPTTLSWLNSTCWPIYTDFRKVIKHTEASRHIPWFHQQLLPWEGRAWFSHIIPIHDFILWFHIIWTHRKYIIAQNDDNTIIRQQRLHASHYSNLYIQYFTNQPPTPNNTVRSVLLAHFTQEVKHKSV